MGWNNKDYKMGSVSLNNRDRFNEDAFDEFMVELTAKVAKLVQGEIDTKFGKEIAEGEAIIFVNIG